MLSLGVHALAAQAILYETYLHQYQANLNGVPLGPVSFELGTPEGGTHSGAMLQAVSLHVVKKLVGRWLQRGDILHALNDEVLDDVADFYRKLWDSGAAGTTVRLRMERDSDAFEVGVRSGDRSSYHKYGSD